MHLRSLRSPSPPKKCPNKIDIEILNKYKLHKSPERGSSFKHTDEPKKACIRDKRLSRPKKEKTRREEELKRQNQKVDELFGDLDLSKDNSKLPSKELQIEKFFESNLHKSSSSNSPSCASKPVSKSSFSDSTSSKSDHLAQKGFKSVKARKLTSDTGSSTYSSKIKNAPSSPDIKVHSKSSREVIEEDSCEEEEDWRSLLRKVTGYNPNDLKYRRLDAQNIPADSGFDQINNEEKKSRKIAIKEDREELEKLKKLV
ncbi:uncharacterized protein LOC126320479 [Schistocerca gregaria]|uniref:uncharacterized protein LOC126320479 n=1 Tax=Schistocerca gregaria TaxID=7010 RepID=UPI00211E955B|nr:uncharacterized protein LOC126320479 [Schistocerca gregaria]